ncbi:MAG: hypothetical protein FD169_1564 [Bacillota bacterium]|nr:MAG: hypothetical protein FD169_1564 [Bacillota bacterium]
MAFLVLGGFLLCGCWDQQEITELAAVTGLGLDPGSRPNTIRMSVQISPPSPAGAAGGVGGSRLRTITVEAASLGEAMVLLQSRTRREPFLQHLGYVVFGEELAKTGIAGVIAGLQGIATVRGSVSVFVAAGTAAEVLQAHSGIGHTPGQDVVDLLGNMSNAPVGRSVNLNDVINTLTVHGNELAIPILELTPLRLEAGDEKPEVGVGIDDEPYQEVLVARTALFSRDKWVQDLDPYLTQVFINLVGATKSGTRTIPNPVDPAGKVVVEYESFSTSYKATINDSRIVEVQLQVKIKTRILEIHGTYDLRTLGFDPINSALSQGLASHIEELVVILKEHQSDALGLGQMISRTRPKDWSKLESDWNELFTRTDIKVSVSAQVMATNVINKYFEIKR